MNNRNIKKYIGQTYGVFTILDIDIKYEDYKYSFKQIKCKCICSRCGKESEVYLNSLYNNLKMCEHCKSTYKSDKAIEKYIGTIKGNLQCLEYAYLKNKRHYVKVKCLNCGNIFIKPITYFNSPAHKGSTFCSNCKTQKYAELKRNTVILKAQNLYSEKYDLYQKINEKISEYKTNAKRRNIQFHLSREDCKELFLGNCIYCNQPQAFGIDRVDSMKHYTKDNTVSCCSMCNRMKNSYTKDEFLNKIKDIYLFSIIGNSTTIPKGSTSEANADGSAEHPN